ncbi:MAG: uncharacterized protein KVP18_003656 [Porospora cf. gigantea A]|uniref:uncharacterized protein n=1 Tax=Porospora cf. gigantea A TaxID=2853593 RepID=UPI003559AB39|nr:MAG: hypothetical protein KVP18_003656 [Porospora cf. gigantea A]
MGFFEEASPLVRVGSLFLDNDDLMDVFNAIEAVDPEVRRECLRAACQMEQTPYDRLDEVPAERNIRQMYTQGGGLVDRRSPPNPLAPFNGRKRGLNVKDPALHNNPLLGRLLTTWGTTWILFFIFLQELILNFTTYGTFHAPRSRNWMIGPEPQILHDMGGLSTNRIREGEYVRLFWSMWMHSGWIHLGINLLSQLQYLYIFEPDWGFWRTFSTYAVSGVTGNLVSAIADPCSVTVGSSGALFGLMAAMVAYCMEFWRSIPRPKIILAFSVIVVLVSIIMGFTNSTDNWAHMGGMIGGLGWSFFCLPVVQVWSLGAQIPGYEPKPVIRKAPLVRKFQIACNPGCKCSPSMLALRMAGILPLVAIIYCCIYYLFWHPEFQPPGHVSFSVITACCCCRAESSLPVICNPCSDPSLPAACHSDDPFPHVWT